MGAVKGRRDLVLLFGWAIELICHLAMTKPNQWLISGQVFVIRWANNWLLILLLLSFSGLMRSFFILEGVFNDHVAI